MKQILKIGKVYTFNYKRKTKAVYNEGHITVRLTDDERRALIHEINSHAEDIRLAYVARNMQLTEYKNYVGRLEMMRLARKAMGPYNRKTTRERELEDIVKSFKKKFFPKRTTKPTQREIARGLFLRNLKHENMAFSKDGKIKAIYAGKRVTANCDIMHRWYVLNETKAPASVVEANDLTQYIEVVK